MKITIGRDPDSTIVISEDYDIVSNEHADIELQGSDIMFIDHSSNGTIINGQKIHGQSVKIFPHDKIMLAGVCQLDWAQINQYIPRQGRPTVVHNIRSNVTTPPQQTYPPQQPYQLSEGQHAAGVQQGMDDFARSRPTELRNQRPVGGQNANDGWNQSQQSRVTEQWHPDHPTFGGGFDSSTNGGRSTTSGNTLSQRDQRELAQWNWGAFYFGWFWGIFHKVWLALIQLAISMVNSILNMTGNNHFVITIACWLAYLGVGVWMGMKGTQTAWNNGAWRNMEHMRRSRHNWNVAALVCFIATTVLTVIMIAFFFDILLSLY